MNDIDLARVTSMQVGLFFPSWAEMLASAAQKSGHFRRPCLCRSIEVNRKESEAVKVVCGLDWHPDGQRPDVKPERPKPVAMVYSGSVPRLEACASH